MKNGLWWLNETNFSNVTLVSYWTPWINPQKWTMNGIKPHLFKKKKAIAKNGLPGSWLNSYFSENWRFSRLAGKVVVIHIFCWSVLILKFFILFVTKPSLEPYCSMVSWAPFTTIINFDLSMDEWLYPLWSVAWNYSSIPKLEWCGTTLSWAWN